MNRNTQERFSATPRIDIQRSRFLMNPEVKTTFSNGSLIPIGQPIEVLPGDTFEINTALAVRMQPLVSAPFDNLSFDYYWFFVPLRLCWSHFVNFMGENTESAWIPQTEYTIPQLDFIGGAMPGSIADYMGIPTKRINTEDTNKYIHLHASALPFRAFALIYNNFFRSQNIIDPVNVSLDDSNRLGYGYQSDRLVPNDVKIATELGGMPPKVGKRPDYFVSCLPAPIKHSDITLMDHMPVYFDGDYAAANRVIGKDSSNYNTLDGKTVNGHTGKMLGRSTGPSAVSFPISLSAQNPGYRVDDYVQVGQPYDWFVDSNLTIDGLRTAFQLNKLYYRDAVGGTRYREQLTSHFNVTSPDASQQVPQYLGGRRVPININSVVQTSESNNTPQGNIAGVSLTSSGSRHHDFIFSSTEHGYLICVGCSRIDQHSYQNGLHRSWSRKTREEFYWPELANLANQPVLNKELFCYGGVGTSVLDSTPQIIDNPTDEEVFGYQEAWAEYRYQPSLITGRMRSNLDDSLDVWHFGDDYTTWPRLSEDWFNEDPSNIDRVLAVQSSVTDQFFGDFSFNIKATRPMPMFSVPGLADHH